MAGYDEEGGLAPWMVQPEESENIITKNPVSTSYSTNMPGQIMAQQLIQPQHIIQFQPGYQNYNHVDYMNGYNLSQQFPKQVSMTFFVLLANICGTLTIFDDVD